MENGSGSQSRRAGVYVERRDRRLLVTGIASVLSVVARPVSARRYAPIPVAKPVPAFAEYALGSAGDPAGIDSENLA
jgi:hypothetical protein